MQKVKIAKFLSNAKFFEDEAKKGKIFLYPTDTIYWLGAIPNEKTIEKIYEIKKRQQQKPLSIISPSIEWIEENFIINNDFQSRFWYYFEKYEWITVILQKKDKNFLKQIWKDNKVWIRIIKSPFQNFVSNLWQPFVTTSANISWSQYKQDYNTFLEFFQNTVDYFIDWGKLSLTPSTIIDFTNWENIIR